MKVVGLRDAKTHLTEVGLQAARGERALVTRRGRPFFVIVGVEGEDLLDVLIRWDPRFWTDLEARRARSAKSSVSLSEFEAAAPRRARPRSRRG